LIVGMKPFTYQKLLYCNAKCAKNPAALNGPPGHAYAQQCSSSKRPSGQRLVC
jgi:hypothetical protein